MTPERWHRLEELFVAAFGRDAQERAAFLDGACGDDVELRREVDAMLASSTDAGSALRETIAEEASALAGARADTQVGRRLGPYRLVSLIGEGGMGTVYLAERDDAQFRQRVAIKVLQPGMASPQLAARLRDERQVLASLEHPGIVRLVDGGRTDDGLPYLVMEHVEGTPLLAWARGRALRDVIGLVLEVADALQFAHQKLVVHRDVKPSNILVDINGAPKLLDFGIAKLLDPDANERREASTRTGMAMFTLEYASPEQIRGELITVGADVYSLGAVLYHLLVGRPPQRSGTDLIETLREVCEREVERPGAVRRELTGDLDNILLTALAKTPERRYASIAAFADDLRRYLDGRPVHAREATLGYRVRRFVWRHRRTLGLAVLMTAALTTATIFSIIQARRADVAAARSARENRALLVEQARQELDRGRAARALPFLAEALRAGEDTPAVRFLIAEAMRPFAATTAEVAFPAGLVAIAWSRDGTRFATTSMDGVASVHRADGTHVTTMNAQRPGLRYPVFDPTGSSFVAAADDGQLFSWDATTGAMRWSTAAHPLRGRGAALLQLVGSRDGAWWITTGYYDGVIAVWDAATGERLASIQAAAPEALRSLALSHDGRSAWVGDRDGAIVRWDLVEGRETARLASRGQVQQLAVSPDGARLYSAGDQGLLTIWDLRRLEPIAGVAAESTFELAVDGSRVLTRGTDRTTRVWDARDGALIAVLSQPDLAWTAHFSPDGRAIVTCGHSTYRVWDVESKLVVSEIEATPGAGSAPGSPSGILDARFSPDGTQLLMQAGTRATVRRLDRGAEIGELRTSAAAYTAAYSPDDAHVVGAGAGWIRVWEGIGEGAVASVDTGGIEIWDARWSPDGAAIVATGGRGYARILARDGAVIRELVGHDGTVNRGAFRPDGTLVITAGNDGTARIWDAVTGREVRALRHPDRVLAATWSSDGARVATAGWDHTIRIWDAATGALLRSLEEPGVELLDVTFSPDGYRLASSGHGGEAAIWDLRDARRVVRLQRHEGATTTTAWSPDGSLLATSGDDAIVVIWDVATGVPLAIRRHHRGVMSVVWSGDGERLLTATDGGTIHEWDARRDRRPVSEVVDFVARHVPFRIVAGRLEAIGG